MTHLDQLEAEAVHVIREVAAELERPVLLFSGGKPAPDRSTPAPTPPTHPIAPGAAARITERGETRADDRVSEAAMEDRKRVGYF